MNSIQVSSPTPFSSKHMHQEASSQPSIPSTYFGNTSTEEAKQETASLFQEITAEIKQFFNKHFNDFFSRLKSTLEAGKQGLKTILRVLSIGSVLRTAGPKSSFESRARSLGTLAYTEFYDTLLQSEENPLDEQKALLFALYNSVLQEFPGLLKVPTAIKLREKPFIQRLIETRPNTTDEINTQLFDILSNSENQQKLAGQPEDQLRVIAQSLANGDPKQMQQEINAEIIEETEIKEEKTVSG